MRGYIAQENINMILYNEMQLESGGFMNLIYRMKILMTVLQEFGARTSSRHLHNLLFLYCYKFVDQNIYYEFIPQDDGPHSLLVEADKVTLINKKCIENDKDWVIVQERTRFAMSLDFFEQIALQQLKNTWYGKSEVEVHECIKQNYPNYFKSAIREELNQDIILYTIGYEGRSPESYINALHINSVRLLCDIRKNAYSKKYGFSKDNLKSILEKVGIGYKHIPDLGIISQKRQNLNNDSDYNDLFKEYEKNILPNNKDKLFLLKELLIQNKRIALTCFEKKVINCHRWYVARALKQLPGFNYKVEHL